nr:hypothetical protein BaRGS_019362 [Batillaria attramentaria]
MYDFDNETDVETAVNELAAAANNGELYIIADEAYHYDEASDDSDDDDNNTSGRFSEFVTHLSNRHWPEYCERCADNIVDLLVELRVGQSGHDLQYRDTVILCGVPRDNLPVLVNRMSVTASIILIFTIVINSSFIVINN